MTFRAEFEHRDELRRAALDEFCARGYEGASLNRILSASGVSKGQLYHHFDGKEGLYLALVEWMLDEKVAWFAEHPPPAGDGFFETLAARIRAGLRFAAEHPDVERLSRGVLAERGRPVFDRVVARFGFDADGPLAELVALHHGRGELRTDVPLELLQRTVLVFVNQLPELLDLREPADLDDRLDAALELLRSALSPPGRAGAPGRR